MKHYRTPLEKLRSCTAPLRTAVLFGLAFLLQFALIAQDCVLGCNGSPELPLNVTADDNCLVALTTDAILEAPQDCPGDKLLTVRDTLNTLIAESVEIVQFDASALVGSRLSVTVTDISTGLLCVGFVRIMDNNPPTVLNCEELTVDCLADTHPDQLGYPIYGDNCDPNPTLTFADEFMAADCFSDTAGILHRTWTVMDAGGLTATCVQDINIMRATFTDVVFPGDVNLSCDTPDADPAVTGTPQLNGMELMNGDLCGLNTVYSDDTTFICSNYMYQIERTWTVTEDCTDFFGESIQTILVADDEGPQMSCPDPADLVFSTSSSVCSATVTLPQIAATDNCGSNINFTVSTSFGAVGFGPHAFVPEGTHQVQYQATDECGNVSTCQVALTVVDNAPPTAICDDQILVSIGGQGVSVMPAVSFDEGSEDNCAPQLYFKARRDIAGSCEGINGDDSPAQGGSQEWFDDQVIFCCADVDQGPIMVTLRVYEVDPGAGPVSPDLNNNELNGHYTDCPVTVSVQDAINPVFTSCPPAITISCDQEQEDLSGYGHVVVVDNCSLELDSTLVVEVDDCGVGTILRSWTATDPSGNSSTCSQLITVENNAPMPEESIIWPPDYTTFICGASTDIIDLPEENQYPIINWDGCGVIGVNHEDTFFDISEPACYKILRRWTVIDWCHYNPDLPGTPGEFVYTQEIKVRDNTAPVMNCPADMVVSVGSDCATAQVTVPEVTASDCSTDLIFTNDSPYAESGGADASGEYPVATTTVTYTASDRCGNISSCTVDITVDDNQAPSIVCIVGLSTSINDVDGELIATLPAEAFVGSASDNCDPLSEVSYTIKKADGGDSVPSTTEVSFGCLETGTQMVEVWATDSKGNSDYCLTVVSIQDNMGYCTNTTGMGMIAGGVLTEEGNEVEDVQINVSGGGPGYIMTGLDGAFMFDELPLGGDYTVTAYNNDNILNGVSTIDLIYMAKHVLGTQPLDSPYKIIAADIDRSGHISTLDIIKLRKLILLIDDELPNNNTSWRFVDAEFVFPDPANPFTTYFPEVYNVNNLDDDMMHADFVAIKVGDVNGSAVPNSFFNSGDDRSTGNYLDLTVYNQEVQVGETVEIPFYGHYLDEMQGYQFTLEFNPNALELEEIIPGDMPNLYPEENFGLTYLENGLITTVWNEYGESAPGSETLLFTLRCRAKQAGELQEWLYLSSRLTKAAAYSQSGDEVDVQLSVISTAVEEAASFELFQNRPNPWKNETIIPFQLQEGGEAQLLVYDLAGKQVYQLADYFEAGYHEIGISRSLLPSTGLFYYTLETGDQRATRKMVLTD